MVNKLTRPRVKALPKALGDGDGNPVHNAILLDLTRKDCESVLSKLEPVQLPVHTVLNEMAEPIKYGYFINSGLASILNVMSDGKSVEVGLSGREGFVGLPLIVGFDTSPTQAVMQIGGHRLQSDRRGHERYPAPMPAIGEKLTSLFPGNGFADHTSCSLQSTPRSGRALSPMAADEPGSRRRL